MEIVEYCVRIFLRIKNDKGFKLAEEKKSFSKLFEITKKYLSGAYLYKDMVTDTISEDVIRRHISSFNKFNLLKKTSSGVNVFNDDLFDKNIFNNINFNAFTISALIFIKHELTTKILKYIFKDSVTETRNQFIYKYDRFFNEKVLCLADNEKYKKILNQRIYNRTDTTKLSMEYKINNKIYKLVIVDMFIHEDSWYIIAYNIDNKKLEVYDQNDIKFFRNPKDYIQTVYIDPKIFENIIINFIEAKSSSKEEVFYVKAPLGIINNLLSSEIINDFEAYYENSNYKKKYDYQDEFEEDDNSSVMMSKYNYSDNNKRTIRKKLHKDIHISKINLDDYTSKEIVSFNSIDDLEYYSSISNEPEYDYIFKIKTTSIKKKFITKNFKGQIEILNKSSIKFV